MRLISQEEKIDVPYEMGSLTVSGGMITYYNYSCQKGTAMAVYHSEEKAIKVMENVRNRYAKFILFQTTYQNGVLEKLTKELGENEALNIVTPIFRFPKDDEVEV